MYYQLGIRSMTLHIRATTTGRFVDGGPEHNGLTDFGGEGVREMHRLGCWWMLRMFPTKRSTRRWLSPRKGYRVVVLYLWGHGSTRVLSDETFRNGQQSVVAPDIIALIITAGGRPR
jgi:hypothetical protein